MQAPVAKGAREGRGEGGGGGGGGAWPPLENDSPPPPPRIRLDFCRPSSTARLVVGGYIWILIL